jgi:mono/diheme cytochrome c family protein
MPRHPAILALAAVSALALPAASPARAQGVAPGTAPGTAQSPSGQGAATELAAEGQRLADTWCANCHVVGPQQRTAPGDAAPSFTAIAMRPSTTAASLRDYLRTPHPNMPDYRLTNQQLDALAAYILGQVRR